MATEVKLPRLGQGMESGTIVKWLKGEGEPGSEARAPLRTRHGQGHTGGRGRGRRRPFEDLVDSGEVEVGKTIAFIGNEGEDVPSGNGAAPAAAEDKTDEADEADEADDAAEADEEPQEEGSPGRGDGRRAREGRQAAAATAEAATTAVTDAPVRPDGRVKASPLARRLAREKGIDIATLSGSGPEGRIVAEDVERGAVGGAGGRFLPQPWLPLPERSRRSS